MPQYGSRERPSCFSFTFLVHRTRFTVTFAFPVHGSRSCFPFMVHVRVSRTWLKGTTFELAAQATERQEECLACCYVLLLLPRPPLPQLLPYYRAAAEAGEVLATVAVRNSKLDTLPAFQWLARRILARRVQRSSLSCLYEEREPHTGNANVTTKRVRWTRNVNEKHDGRSRLPYLREWSVLRCEYTLYRPMQIIPYYGMLQCLKMSLLYPTQMCIILLEVYRHTFKLQHTCSTTEPHYSGAPHADKLCIRVLLSFYFLNYNFAEGACPQNPPIASY